MNSSLKFDEISPPENCEIEITAFGPGVGESIVLHIPGMGWAVIDSCEFKNNDDKFIPPLEYLIHQDVRKLAFLALSHPHQDHYAGMEKIIDYYTGKIDRICRYAGDSVRELSAYLTRKAVKGNPGAKSFASVLSAFQKAKDSGAEVRRLGAMTKIIPLNKVTLNGISYDMEVLSLSPMAEDEESYINILREALANQDLHIIDIPDTKHNLISSAIWIKIGEIIIVLGSDVERGYNNLSGWRGILGSIDKPNLGVKALKVAHHGSRNAHHNKAWSEHCSQGKIISIITPYSRATKPLPTEEDIKRIGGSSSCIGITTDFSYLRPLEIYSRAVSKRLPVRWRVLNESKDCGMITIRFDLKGNITFQKAIKPANWIIPT